MNYSCITAMLTCSTDKGNFSLFLSDTWEGNTNGPLFAYSRFAYFRSKSGISPTLRKNYIWHQSNILKLVCTMTGFVCTRNWSSLCYLCWWHLPNLPKSILPGLYHPCFQERKAVSTSLCSSSQQISGNICESFWVGKTEYPGNTFGLETRFQPQSCETKTFGTENRDLKLSVHWLD